MIIFGSVKIHTTSGTFDILTTNNGFYISTVQQERRPDSVIEDLLTGGSIRLFLVDGSSGTRLYDFGVRPLHLMRMLYLSDYKPMVMGKIFYRNVEQLEALICEVEAYMAREVTDCLSQDGRKPSYFIGSHSRNRNIGKCLMVVYDLKSGLLIKLSSAVALLILLPSILVERYTRFKILKVK